MEGNRGLRARNGTERSLCLNENICQNSRVGKPNGSPILHSQSLDGLRPIQKYCSDRTCEMPEKRSRERTIVSACLAGVRCVNYPSLVFEHEGLVQLVADSLAIPLCSEQLGGLPTPRPPVGFVGGDSRGSMERIARASHGQY